MYIYVLYIYIYIHIYIYIYIYTYKHIYSSRCKALLSVRLFRLVFAYCKKPTRVAAPPPRASLGRCMVCGRMEQRRPPVSKRYGTKSRIVWGSFRVKDALQLLSKRHM